MDNTPYRDGIEGRFTLPRLNLPHDWWIRWRDKQPVKREFAKAHADHWVGIVDAALKRNELAGAHPDSWTGLAGIGPAVHVDPGHLGRQRKGVHPRLSGHYFLSIATILDLPIATLFPDKQHWLARATERLCGRSLSRADAEIFASYCLGRSQGPPATDHRIDPAALRDAVQSGGPSEQACQAAVVHVDAQLARVLQSLLNGG